MSEGGKSVGEGVGEGVGAGEGDSVSEDENEGESGGEISTGLLRISCGEVAEDEGGGEVSTGLLRVSCGEVAVGVPVGVAAVRPCPNLGTMGDVGGVAAVAFMWPRGEVLGEVVVVPVEREEEEEVSGSGVGGAIPRRRVLTTFVSLLDSLGNNCS